MTFFKVILGFLFLCPVVYAAGELRAWTAVDGKTIEAEFICIIGDKVVLRSNHNKNLKIPLSQFIPEDILHIELSQPPTLDINFTRVFGQKLFKGGFHDYWPRPPEDRGFYGFRIKQSSSGKYSHELRAVMYVIGLQRVMNDRAYIVLDHQTTFLAFSELNKRAVEFRSDHEVVLRDFNVFDSPRGEKFFGYLITVMDARDKIIAVKASHDWLAENVAELEKRRVGQYMDKTCTRCLAGRPDNVIWRNGDSYNAGY